MKLPIWKTNPLRLKREVPFHEMTPRKSTINNNLKSSQNPSKVWVKKFIFSKFADLQAYSQQLYYQMNSTTGIFQQNFKLPLMLPPCIELSIKFWRAPPHVLNTCGKPWVCCGGGRGSLKSEWKQTGGGEESNLSLCSLCEKLPDFSNNK